MKTIGYRTEQLYGEGYRDAAAVMAHEVFELQNTDILDTISDTIFKNTETGAKLKHLSDVINCKTNDDDLDTFCDEAFEDETIGMAYFTDILDELKNITGKDIKYVLWLCDSIADIKREYESENIDVKLTVFDTYETSDIILSDLGTGGKLYGYEHEPIACE